MRGRKGRAEGGEEDIYSFLEAILEIMENIEKLENKKGMRAKGRGGTPCGRRQQSAAAVLRWPTSLPGKLRSLHGRLFCAVYHCKRSAVHPGQATENSLFVLFPSLSHFSCGHGHHGQASPGEACLKSGTALQAQLPARRG